MGYRFNPPPTWPPAPPGWSPPPGWQPPADWPRLPDSWQLWIPDTEHSGSKAVTSSTGGPERSDGALTTTPSGENGHVPRFGARKRLRQVEADLKVINQKNHQLHQAAEAERVRNTRLETQLRDSLHRNATLVSQLEDLTSRYQALRGKDAVALDREIQDAKLLLARLARDAAERHSVDSQQRSEASRALTGLQRQIEEARTELYQTRQAVVETEEIALLQEAGIYEYRHPLSDAVAYKAALERLKASIKSCIKNNRAITATTSWSVNNSIAEGQRMVRDFSKLMLRAYNAEADTCARSMRPHRLESSISRLNTIRDVISRLGQTMRINISGEYHSLRLKELELTSDYLAKVEEEKERIRAERERQRDEEQARREFQRERARLAKEMAHWQTVMQKWTATGDVAKVAEAESKLGEIGQAIKGVEEREANVRTGWVYVISNVGSFGHNIVKVGLTRRLDPMERVRELGDASVPFKFDVHAFIFDADAVSLETRLHQRLADQRVNRVNLRREFFHATPAEILDVLRDMGLDDKLVDYVQEPEAQEWRASQKKASASE